MKNNTSKMTKAQAFAICIEIMQNSTHPDKDEVVAKLNREIELLDKKKATGNSKTKAINMGLGELVVAYLRKHSDESYTATDLIKYVEGLPEEITPQKMTAILCLDTVKPFYTTEMIKGRKHYTYAEVEGE